VWIVAEVAVAAMSTLAPATGLPWGSVTIPEMLPVPTACGKRKDGRSKNATNRENLVQRPADVKCKIMNLGFGIFTEPFLLQSSTSVAIAVGRKC
jgi:hypothetical protein